MKNLITSATVLLLLAISSCKSPVIDIPSLVTTGRQTDSIHEEKNSVYYWKTVFALDSADEAFIKNNNIGRVYLRMFDVSTDNYATEIGNRTVPNASVRIDEKYNLSYGSLSHIEFIPVVYITLDALKTMRDHEGILAYNIVNRVCNMCSFNSLPNVEEIQLDCDWTTSTESLFFNLCDSVRQQLKAHDLPWRISSTIRLHQLSQKKPPVDNGVLMVYNTGNFDNPDASNSIIDIADIKPYLNHHLSSYPLHLDIAYPTYSWQLLFHNRVFRGLINGINLSDTTKFTRRDSNVYVAKKEIPYKNRIIHSGDIIREENSEYRVIAEVKNKIEQCFYPRPHSNILYHLDSKNLSTYTLDEINSIFSVND